MLGRRQLARVRRLMADSRIHQAMGVTMPPAPKPTPTAAPRMMRAAMPRNALGVWRVAEAGWRFATQGSPSDAVLAARSLPSERAAERGANWIALKSGAAGGCGVSDLSKLQAFTRAIVATLPGLAANHGYAGVGASAETRSRIERSRSRGERRIAFGLYRGGERAIRSRLFYPDAARARRARGVVSVAFTIGASGALASFAITHSSGDKDLDAAARAVAQSAHFPPPPGGSAHVVMSFNYAPR
jgi:TonB family protein